MLRKWPVDVLFVGRAQKLREEQFHAPSLWAGRTTNDQLFGRVLQSVTNFTDLTYTEKSPGAGLEEAYSRPIVSYHYFPGN